MAFVEDYLSPAQRSPRRSPSKLGFSKRLSSASLHPGTGDDPNASGRFSLAHELAVALMPEPSAGSKLLAEEFGIEYDEGAEGIDPSPRDPGSLPEPDYDTLSADSASTFLDVPPSPSLSSPTSPIDDTKEVPTQPEYNSIDILSENLESTNNLLAHLRHLDLGAPAASSHSYSSASTQHNQPALEKTAADVIRHLNDTSRDRESQLRELLECDRELRKIAGEVGGDELLSRLDELEGIEVEESQDSDSTSLAQQQQHQHRRTGTEDSIPTTPTTPVASSKGKNHLGDCVPELSSFRASTTSLLSSLSIISDQTQVNGAATADAGRKIRALKNKLGGWRTDWDLAEQSRLRIERWGVGIPDDDIPDANHSPQPRMDGRLVVKEHLRAFELALADAALKTDAIAARA